MKISMKQLDKMSSGKGVKQFLRPETVAVTERAAYDMFKELQELALKDGGMTAVAGVGIAAGEQIEEVLAVCVSEKMDEPMTRAVIAGFMLTSWLPPAIAYLQEKTA